MSLIRRIRGSRRVPVLYRAATVCIAALCLLWVRSAPPSLPHISHSLAVRARTHDQRQCFDHQYSQWLTLSRAPLFIPPPVVSPHLTNAVEPFVEAATDGLHYNRPPPVG